MADQHDASKTDPAGAPAATELERRFQSILDAVPAPIWFKDLAGIYQGCNAAFERYLGQPRGGIVGHTVFEVAPPDLARTYRAADDALFRTGDTQEYETQVEWADGSRREVVFRKAVIRDRDGATAGLAGMMLDVTELRAAERQLRARLAQQAALAALAGRALGSERPVDLVVDAVRTAVDALGFTGGSVLELADGGELLRPLGAVGVPPGHGVPLAQLPLADAVLSADRAVWLEDAAAAPASAIPPSLRAAGARRLAATRVGSRDAPLAILLVHADTPGAVSEEDLGFLDAVAHVLAIALSRRTALALARAHADSFQRLVDASPDYVVLHRRGVILYANAALARRLGRPGEALVGTSVLDWTHPDDAAAIRDRVLSTSEKPPLEVRIGTAGGWRWAEFLGVEIDVGGEPARVALGRDLTERKEAEVRLAVADRLASVGRVAAGVAHELNNPLAFVRANLEWAVEQLAEGATDPARIRDAIGALEEAVEGTDRMRVIVRDLRTLSTAGAEEHGPVDVARALEFAVKLAAPELRGRARVIVDVEPVAPVRGSEARLGQVFLNLIVNAAHAVSDEAAVAREVRIRARAHGADRVAIEISDTGPGIAPELQSRIFEPFFTTKPAGVGTGLGLWVCRNIVAAHGGALEVESAPGEGATFRVVLDAIRDGAPAAGRRPADAVTPRLRSSSR
ncbi:PAS domain-containing sensor histidine kinase [Anaeromyxobacter oryzae]|uniref:histidine kinase n=1 Tax=Anaeromyxobacter oryzae TaxID=2918170 RepID=A0ABM7WR20_9BACT|nr:PAS domain S-box protein [Anaeromyxobacter oryzae]BDG01913.1 hypothetical protein AMOR_09090 [Anaeromyxobacter oryzae]